MQMCSFMVIVRFLFVLTSQGCRVQKSSLQTEEIRSLLLVVNVTTTVL